MYLANKCKFWHFNHWKSRVRLTPDGKAAFPTANESKISHFYAFLFVVNYLRCLTDEKLGWNTPENVPQMFPEKIEKLGNID